MSDQLPAAEMRLISPARAGRAGNPIPRGHDHQTGLSKSELVSSVSHELRTPLTVITGYVELLRQIGMGQLDEQQLRFIKAIEEDLTELLGASEQLIELLQLEWGERQIALEPLDLTALLVTETRRWRDKLAKKKLTLTTELESRPLWIKGDWELLSQVVR